MRHVLEALVWVLAGLAALVLAIVVGVPAWVARRARRH